MKGKLLALGLVLCLALGLLAGCRAQEAQADPGDGKLKTEIINGEEYPLLGEDYGGDYSLREVCFVSAGERGDWRPEGVTVLEIPDFYSPPEDFNRTAVMKLEDYAAYCEKWGLEPAYQDRDKTYLVIAYASPGATRLELNLADVTLEGDTAVVWLRDILGGFAAESRGYVLTIPIEAEAAKVETRRVYTRQEVDNLKQFGTVYDPSHTEAPEKPVIYLYPETETQVRVRLDYEGVLTCAYPPYEGGWEVTAAPDGTLTDRRGRQYDSLFWEGRDETVYDFSQGFCVAGADTAAFLEEALAKLGLTEREANAFLVYWLPRMQENPWNLIAFQGAAYTDAARLDIQPAPDTLLRVFMAWKPLEAPVEVAPQTLEAPERRGFTAVEWGGAEVQN